MSLADLLGLSDATAAAPQSPLVGAPLTPDQLAALPYVQVPQRPTAPPQQSQSQPQAQSGGHGLRDFIGRLSDALFSAAGGQGPGMYEQLQTGRALSNFLGDPAGSMQQLMRVNPSMGAQMLQAQLTATPQFVRDIRAAGIDPASDEGRKLTEMHFGKQPSSSIQDYEYARSNGYQGDFASFVRDYLRPQLQSPVVLPAGAVPVGQPSAKPALRFNSQTGQWEPE